MTLGSKLNISASALVSLNVIRSFSVFMSSKLYAKNRLILIYVLKKEIVNLENTRTKKYKAYVHALEEQVRLVQFHQSHHEVDLSVEINISALKVLAKSYIHHF